MAEQRTLKVSDTLADKAGVSRTHTLLDATGAEKDFTFKPGEPIDIPFDLAFGLVANPGFAVHDPKTGRRLKADPARASLAKIELKPDETIANLDELTREALLVRARRLPGGEAVPQGAPKQEVLLFVMAGGVRQDRDLGDIEEPSQMINERMAA